MRAAHDRSLDAESERLWQKLESQSIRFDLDINLPVTATRKARIAQLAIRFCPVQLRTPYRFEHREPLKVHAVYATEVDCPQAETPVSWMLLTTEVVADIHTAATILPGTLIAGILRNITKFSSRAVKSSDLDWQKKE